MNFLKDLALLAPPIRRMRDARNSLAGQVDALRKDLADLRHNTRFHFYDATFDPKKVIRRHALPNVQPSPDHLTNFMGVKVRPEVLPSYLEQHRGKVEGIPLPANWHADISEWGFALRAVDMARETFTIVELGCGWGCWMNNTGVAARRIGLVVDLIGIEGDDGHLEFARRALADNGFSLQDYTLHRGIAAATGGTALFPRQDQPGEGWGSEPVFGASEEQHAKAVKAGSHDVLSMITLSDVAGDCKRVDLLHIDIQGGEGDFVDGCLPVMNDKVARVLIGTHSRELEGRLIDSLAKADWMLEIERPAIVTVGGHRPTVTVDGVQGWRNPRLDWPV